jgi:Family of unknown function (DUF5946)
MACPGCSLEHAADTAPAPARYRASAACWKLFGELSAYTLSLSDSTFMHQHAVDAYGAQHGGEPARPVTTVYALIGLYLAVERGYDGRQVQQAHMRMARSRTAWPALAPPAAGGDVNVSDVLQAAPGEARAAMLRQWASSEWSAWADRHAWVRAVAAEQLGVPP